MAQYITYEYDDGKFAKIPLEEIERLMKLPNIKTQDDACWVWCEDNGKIINEEQEELTKKAKENKVTATIHQAKCEKPTTRKKVERKPDQIKDSLMERLKDYLTEIGLQNVKVVKVGKLIEFDIDSEHFKLDLIRQRPPKAKG
jgi:DNA-binding transcriptional MerR regulator